MGISLIPKYIYDNDCSIFTDDCRLKFHVLHQIAPRVSSGGSEGRQLIYKDDDRHEMTYNSQSFNRVDWTENVVFWPSTRPKMQ